MNPEPSEPEKKIKQEMLLQYEASTLTLSRLKTRSILRTELV
jgi:hypothetical protein